MIVRSLLTSRHCIVSLGLSCRILRGQAECRRYKVLFWAPLKENQRQSRHWYSGISAELQNAPSITGLDAKGEAAPLDVQEELRKLGFGVFPLGEHTHLQCPKCGGGDSGDKELTLKVRDDAILWICFRGKCGWQGGINFEERRRRARTRPNPTLEPLSHEWIKFFEKRRIGLSTLQRNKIQQTSRQQSKSPVLVFPYFRDGELVNVKYRTADKKFWQHKDAEKILYGWDDIKAQKEIIVVEGEIDKLSLEEAGFRNVTSVPDGAPAHLREGPLPSAEYDKKFSYIWDSKPAFADADRIIIAVDSDKPGTVLARELARRFGEEKCMLVTWSSPQPERLQSQAAPPWPHSVPSITARSPVKGKDANEVLCSGGPAAVRACLQAAVPFPVKGLVSIDSFAGELLQEHSWPPGISGLQTGWSNLDGLYRVVPSCVTVVSGPLLSGKTDFLLELLSQLSKKYDFKAGLCLLEAQDLQPAVKRLLEKHTGKSFHASGPPQQRMQAEELKGTLRRLSEHFSLISGSATTGTQLDAVLELARISISRRKLNGLLIDSFHAMPPAEPSPGAAVSEAMRKLQSFASQHRLHIWLTVHSLSPEDADYLLQLSDVGLTLNLSGQETVVKVQGNNRRCSKTGLARFSRETGSICLTPLQ